MFRHRNELRVEGQLAGFDGVVPWPGGPFSRGKRGLMSALVLLALVAPVPSPAAAATADGPALSVNEELLAASLSCSTLFGAGRDPVLLVHGTATNSQDTWSWNYLRALQSMEFDVCTVDLPDKSLGDIQVAAEYVVNAVRAVAAAAGRPVDVIGHSQGTLEVRWALRWWPDLRRLVDDAISLGGPHHGATSADLLCTSGSCAAAVQQMRHGARFFGALNGGDETPGDVDYTSVYSDTDEVVRPPRTAVLDGAVNVRVQDLCPGRPVHHVGLVDDAPVFVVVLDALTRPGPADPLRFDPASCRKAWMPGVEEPLTGNAVVYGPGLLATLSHPAVAEEPPLAPYAARRP